MQPSSGVFSLLLTQVRSLTDRGQCVRVTGGRRCAAPVNEVNGKNHLVSRG